VPSVAVAKGEELLRYSFPGSHPMKRARLERFYEYLQASVDLRSSIVYATPKLASEEELIIFHTPEYVKFVKLACERGSGFLDYGDTPAFKNCFEAASYVVGTTLEMCRIVLSGEVERAFNPMGGLHHARRGSAGGFCIFNDAGVAIQYLLDKQGLRRVAYVDIDAHHGDGVCYDFYNDSRVVFADIHQDGRSLYPGTGFEYETGEGDAKGMKLNIPLQPLSGDDEFIDAFSRVESFISEFEFDFILLQCGADGIRGDPITSLQYSPRAHRHAAERLARLAGEKCGGRVVAMGGGGYSSSNVAAAWTEVVRGLAGA